MKQNQRLMWYLFNLFWVGQVAVALTPAPLAGAPIKLRDQAGPYAYDSEIISYETEDGASIEATVLQARTEDQKFPGILYVHMWARDRQTFWQLPEFLASHGYSGVYMDLRGHGASKFPPPKQDRRVTTSDSKRRYKEMLYDINPAIGVLENLPNVNRQQLVLIGASLGCPLGVKAIVPYKDQFMGMVHLSPSSSYFDVNCFAELKEMPDMPVLVIAEEEDKSFGQAKRFFDLFTSYKSWIKVKHIGHGSDILYADIGFPTVIKNWLEYNRSLAEVSRHLEKKDREVS